MFLPAANIEDFLVISFIMPSLFAIRNWRNMGNVALILFLIVSSFLISEIIVVVIRLIELGTFAYFLAFIADTLILLAFIYLIIFLERLISRRIPGEIIVLIIVLFGLRILTYLSTPMKTSAGGILFNPYYFRTETVQIAHIGATIPIILTLIFLFRGYTLLSRVNNANSIIFVFSATFCMLSKSLVDLIVMVGYASYAILLMRIYHLSLILLFLVFTLLSKNPLRFVLSPTNLFGFIALTRGGLRIYSKSYKRDKDLLAKASSLLAAFTAISDVMEMRKMTNVSRSERFVDTTLVIYYGMSVIGCLLVSNETYITRIILRDIIKTIEEKIRVNEGFVTDEQSDIVAGILKEKLSSYL